jgi:hypothetical protein
MFMGGIRTVDGSVRIDPREGHESANFITKVTDKVSSLRSSIRGSTSKVAMAAALTFGVGAYGLPSSAHASTSLPKVYANVPYCPQESAQLGEAVVPELDVWMPRIITQTPLIRQ